MATIIDNIKHYATAVACKASESSPQLARGVDWGWSLPAWGVEGMPSETRRNTIRDKKEYYIKPEGTPSQTRRNTISQTGRNAISAAIYGLRRSHRRVGVFDRV